MRLNFKAVAPAFFLFVFLGTISVAAQGKVNAPVSDEDVQKVQLRDSSRQTLLRAIAEMDVQYRTAAQEKQKQIDQLASASQVRTRWTFIGLTCMGLLILGLVVGQGRQRARSGAALAALHAQLEKTNEQLEQANIKLGQAAVQVEEANKEKTRFLGILNHDLRGPVAHLITLLHLREEEGLQEGAGTESEAGLQKGSGLQSEVGLGRGANSQKEAGLEWGAGLQREAGLKRGVGSYGRSKTGRIAQAAEGLLETMEELLVWSKGQMVQFRPHVRAIAVNQLFSDLEKKYTSMAPDGVQMHFEQVGSMFVYTDEQFCQTILRNLTANAFKALDGMINGQITWRAWQEGGRAWMSVTDNGPGATAQQLSPLFDEDATIGIRSGLGLHIVRDMARAINAEVFVHSPAAGGLEVRLKFLY